MNNAYFDGQARNYLQQKDDSYLIDRLKKIKTLSDTLSTSDAWQVVLQDAEAWKQQMDDKWQDVYDEKILANMRIVKQSYMFITQIPDRYKREVELVEEEIASRQDYKRTVEEI